MFDGAITTDLRCQQLWWKMTDRSTFALPNEIYLVTVSHFQIAVFVDLDEFVDVGENRWVMV